MKKVASVFDRFELFDPNKSFIALPIVWWFVCIIVLIAFLLTLVIAINTPLSKDFSADGFNYFLSAFRFPLGVLALIIPIVALLAANHRSEQTKEQIRVTNLQNVFSNHYKHIEEFKKYVEGLGIESMNDLRIRKLHKKMFPNSFQGVHLIDGGVAKDFAQGCEYILERLNVPKDITDIKEAIQRVEDLIVFFCIDDAQESATNMGRSAAVEYAKLNISNIYAIFIFSQDCPDFVHISANRCIEQVGNRMYTKC
ncbi:TPA: hypothetical protein NKS99_000652 [Vibrio parahaemolyticus]|nr:hypothetical protein [Vibrio parahaemolyticus]HCH2826085.1 hypothetical protein [Vibrio parahaemolyticus]